MPACPGVRGPHRVVQSQHDVPSPRVGFYLLTAWIAVSINFFLPRLMPGKPLELIPTRYRIEATPAQVLILETTSGLDTNPGCSTSISAT